CSRIRFDLPSPFPPSDRCWRIAESGPVADRRLLAWRSAKAYVSRPGAGPSQRIARRDWRSDSDRLWPVPDTQCQRLVTVEEGLEVEEMTLTVVVDEAHFGLSQRSGALRPGV